MAEAEFDLTDLFEKAFGYKTRAFDPKFNIVAGNGRVGSLTRTEFGSYGSEYYAVDALGGEYFMPVKFTYIDEEEKAVGSVSDASVGSSQTSEPPVGKLKSWNLPYPVISIQSRKTLIETSLTERRGTVKELINIRDYEIVIKGFIVGATNEFPEQEVKTLRNIYEQNTHLSIQCPLTDIFLLRPDRSGSDQIVITELKFPHVVGVKNIRPYELTILSDEPFNLITIS